MTAAVLLASAASAWEQDAFWISFWVGPQVELPELDARFAELVEANFTGFMGFHGGGELHSPDPTLVAAQIALCDKHGLKCIPTICEDEHTHLPLKGGTCVHLGKNATNLWGFQLFDEPMVADFAALANWSSRVQKQRPGLLRFMNLEGAGDKLPFPNS